MNLRMGVVVFVWCSLRVSECMLTVSNAFLMPSATVIVRFAGLCLLKPVVMVLFMLCRIRIRLILYRKYKFEWCNKK